MTKIVGIVGSPRRGGNSEFLVNEALRAAAEEGAETELISLAGKEIKPCDACQRCRDKNVDCHIQDDLAPIFKKMLEADGIILATPVYIGSATAQAKALIDRVSYWAGGKGRPFENKVGAPIVTGMIIPGTTYWSVAFGREKGEVAKDEEGINTVRNLGKKMAWLTNKLK
jgi:multimeric flavodoxin WrbA